MRLWVFSYATILLLGSMDITVLRKVREIMMRRLNFIGTLITDTELPLGEDGVLWLDKNDYEIAGF